MSDQESNPHVRLLAQIAIFTILWTGTFVATKSDWLGRPSTLSMRLALVVVGIGGFLPILFVYARSILLQDEFTQRVHLVALACAFAFLAAASYAVDLLHQAGFVRELHATGLWAVMVVIWFGAMLITPRFYR